MRKNLVILRCGRNSLHKAWLQGAASRNFDLILCPFEEIGVDPEVDWQSEIMPSQKWTGIAQLLTIWPDWRRYAYIWLPDDDLAADAATIDSLFELSARFNAKISAPSLSEDSFFYHPMTMRNRNFYARAVAYIEVMMPCIRADILEILRPSMAPMKSGFGWGLDYVWPAIIDYQNMVIFDCIAVRHTRAVGSARDPDLVKQGNDEMHLAVLHYGAIAQTKVLGAYDEAGRPRHAGSELFLLDYLNGYRYLIEQESGFLQRLLDEQNAELPHPFARPGKNLALGKPASLSSVFNGANPAAAAAHGNNGSKTGQASFATLREQDPWWQVDLGTIHAISKIALYNNLAAPELCTRLSVAGSAGGTDWSIFGAKLDGAPFGGADGKPYWFLFDPPVAARFVRVAMIGEGVLALDEIEIFADPG